MKAQRSVRYQGQRATLAKLAAILDPTLTTVQGQVHISVETVCDDHIGMRLVRREPVDYRVRFHIEPACLPGLTAILGALDRAALTRNKVAIAHEDRIRIVRL